MSDDEERLVKKGEHYCCSKRECSALGPYVRLGIAVVPDLMNLRSRIEAAAVRLRPVTQAYLLIERQRLRRIQERLIKRNGNAIITELFDRRFRFDLTNLRDVSMAYSFLKGIPYEHEIVKIMRKSLVPDSVFVDVGANNGWFTVVAMSSIDETGEIFSFEPNPSAFERLKENLSLNGGPTNVHAYPVALGESTGEARLFQSVIEDSRASLVGYSGSSKSFVVTPIRPLDEIIPSKRVNLVKIDVEGFELPVLKGMRRIIDKSPHLRVIIEWNRAYASSELWDFLTTEFKMWWAQPGGLAKISPNTTFRSVADLIGNILCERTS